MVIKSYDLIISFLIILFLNTKYLKSNSINNNQTLVLNSSNYTNDTNLLLFTSFFSNYSNNASLFSENITIYSTFKTTTPKPTSALTSATNLITTTTTTTTTTITTTITNSSSSSSSTSTTTSTTTNNNNSNNNNSTSKKPRLLPYITDFKLSNIYYDSYRENFQLTYLIRTNQSYSKLSLIEYAIILNVTINCSAEQEQAWSKEILNQYVSNNYIQSNVILYTRPKDPPRSGSFIKCIALLKSNLQILSSSIYLLMEPAPATDLRLNRINESSLNLTWKNPIDFYDSLNILCKSNTDLNEQYLSLNLALIKTKISKTILMKKNDLLTNEYVLKNLLSGTNYSCLITTYRTVIIFNLTSQVESKSVSQITDLSKPIILNKNLNLTNKSISLELNPPFGLYDYFTINLYDLNQDDDFTIVKNFSFQFATNIKLNLNQTELNLIPGKTYEIWATISRLKDNKNVGFRQEKDVKLIDSFLVPPDPIQNIKIYILTKSSINVTWQAPKLGLSKPFLINLLLNDSKLINLTSLLSNFNWVVLNDLKTSENYLIEISSCSSKPSNTDCESQSDVTQLYFNYSSILKNRIMNFRNYLNETTLHLEWSSNLHDLKKFLLIINNLKSNETTSCFIDLFKNEDNNSSNSCLYDFYLNESQFFLNISALKYNTKYNLTLIPFANSNFELESFNYEFKTRPSLPEKDHQTLLYYKIPFKTESNSFINVMMPKIDQSNGQILETSLFMVKLGLTKHFNETKSFKLDNTRNQEFLKLIFESSRLCTNETSILEPCLLKSYFPNDSILNKKLVFIGYFNKDNSRELVNAIEYKNLNNNNNNYYLNFTLTENDIDNINTSLIEPSSLYQLFFVFKIGDLGLNESNFSSYQNLYFATNPSEPIQTKDNDKNLNSNKTRDGLALWIIILICVISSIVLIGFIITMIVLTLVKYKPSKFHKAAQFCGSGQQQPPNGINNTLNLRSKFAHHDDYLGCDFVIPGEFSRYEMTNIWLVKHANGDLILDEEYRNLPDFRDFKTCYASQSHKNEIKNRFLDIKAYDDSRVVLDSNLHGLNPKKIDQTSADKLLLSSSISNSSNESSSINDYGDYINANFIQGYSHEKKFIATQGPKKETLNDFWRMIYQYKISAIVMLTKLVEKGVERCTQYWPDKLNITETYGDYEVTLKDQIKCGDYIKRVFDLVYVCSSSSPIANTPLGLSRKILTVNQYYYPEWPDKDTPNTDPISILHLIRDVNQNHLPYQYPIVVHCSAGVGRTGTYITLDAMMEKINSESKIDIFGFISKIRERRQYLVQTSKQYIFIHEALYEYCLYNFTDILVSNLTNHYKSLKELSNLNVNGLPINSNLNHNNNNNNNANHNRTKLQIEFEKLCVAFYPNCQAREAFNNDNKLRNRDLNKICYDDNRIRLSSLNGSSYINATFIKGFELNNELIITQDPMPNTQFEFWKMIFEYDCNIIVALNKDFELEKESVYWPNDNEPIRHCEFEDVKFVIQLIKPVICNTNEEAIKNDLITRREFEIIEHKYSGTNKMTVTHFIYNEQWLEDQAPKNRSSFLDLVGQVQKSAIKYERSRIVVHAFGGGSNVSVFCALNILLYQFKNEQCVDVCRTVKKLKTQRPHMIETYEQYEFLYQCLIDFVDMFGIYSQSSNSFNSRTSLDEESNKITKSPQIQPDLRLNQVKLNFD